MVRDLLLGRTRFKEFAAAPEHIPTNILTERLRRLLAHGVIAKVPARPGSKHLAYRLTDRGEALRPALESMRDWSLKWIEGTYAGREEIAPPTPMP